jgi:hypothetical protein
MANHIKRWIEVQFQKEGIHYYPGADTDPKLATGDWDDVSFLGRPHFHYFGFIVKIEVFHNDRDLEFIQVRRWLERLYTGGTLQMDHKSCEMLAEDLYAKITEKWPGRDIVISVSEDDKNRAIMEFTQIK